MANANAGNVFFQLGPMQRSTAGQSLGQGLASFGAGVGAAIQGHRRKQEKKQQEEAMSEFLIGKGYAKDEQEAKAVVKAFGGPQEAFGAFMMEQQQQMAVRKQREAERQAILERAAAMQEQLRKENEFMMRQQDTLADNARDLRRVELAEKKETREAKEAARQAREPQGTARTIRDLDRMEQEAMEAGNEDLAAVYRDAKTKTSQFASQAEIVYGDKGPVYGRFTGPAAEAAGNTVSTQSNLQNRTQEIDGAISTGSSLLNEWEKNPKKIDDYFGFVGNLGFELLDEKAWGQIAGANPQRAQFRKRFGNFGIGLKDALAPDRRLLSADNEELVKAGTIVDGVMSKNPATAKASLEEGMKALRFKRALLQAHSFMPDSQTAFSDMTKEQIKAIPGLTPEEKADIVLYLGK